MSCTFSILLQRKNHHTINVRITNFPTIHFSLHLQFPLGSVFTNADTSHTPSCSSFSLSTGPYSVTSFFFTMVENLKASKLTHWGLCPLKLTFLCARLFMHGDTTQSFYKPSILTNLTLPPPLPTTANILVSGLLSLSTYSQCLCYCFCLHYFIFDSLKNFPQIPVLLLLYPFILCITVKVTSHRL